MHLPPKFVCLSAFLAVGCFPYATVGKAFSLSAALDKQLPTTAKAKRTALRRL